MKKELENLTDAELTLLAEDIRQELATRGIIIKAPNYNKPKPAPNKIYKSNEQL